jgi:hypothetical protein
VKPPQPRYRVDPLQPLEQHFVSVRFENTKIRINRELIHAGARRHRIAHDIMRSFEQLGVEDLTRFQLRQLFKHGFRPSYFERFRCLRETLKGRAERERQEVPIHGSDGDTKSLG